jgi:hypothetical protein
MKYLISLLILVASATGFSYQLNGPTYKADVVFGGFNYIRNFDCPLKDCFLYTQELQQVALKIKFKGHADKVKYFEHEVIYLENHKVKIIVTATVSSLTEPDAGLNFPEKYENIYVTLEEGTDYYNYYAQDEIEIVVVK